MKPAPNRLAVLLFQFREEHDQGRIDPKTTTNLNLIGRWIVYQPENTVVSPYLTCEEAAGYLRTTKQGIYALVKRRRLAPMPGRPGRLLFTRESLDRYLAGRKR